MNKPAALPLSVLIPTKDDATNLERCLLPIVGWAKEIVVVDSHSHDATPSIAQKYNTTLLQFNYSGGWPKKRQWALDNYAFQNQWILLLDTDEILEPEVKKEIEAAIAVGQFDGYWISFRIFFLGRKLRFGDSQLWKLSLFRRGLGRFEHRLQCQDASMGDMEVHEHVIVEGPVSRLRNAIRHENINSLDRYIAKHNCYSNWEAAVLIRGDQSNKRASLCGDQAARRRWLKHYLWRLPGFPVLVFVYIYIFRLGFLDGKAGFYYSCFRAIHFFQTKAKVYETRLNLSQTAPCD